MASSEKNLSTDVAPELGDVSALKVGIVVSQWNEQVTNALDEGCRQTLLEKGVKSDHIFTMQVPGSFELPLGARLLDDKHALDAIVCLGCVIKGETRHDEYINQAVASGIMQLGLMKGKPVIFGLLTCDTQQQALDRAGGAHGNKGVEAALTALQMASLRKDLKQPGKQIGFS